MSDRFPGKDLYPNTFSPIRIGNLRLKNRIIAAPTSPSMITTEGHFTPEMIAYLEEKAKGGCAVVTYGEAIPHSATGKSHNKQLQLDAFGVRQGMTESVRRIHNAGGLANIQLSHGGMYGGLASVGGDVAVGSVAYGPSDMTMPAGEVKEMPKELIYEIVDSYGKAAALCKDVGYDMVQVHAAHGWLFNQFLSPGINHRTDEFGGSLENRARFLLLVLDAVRKAVGPGFPIELRLNGDDFLENGLALADYVEVAKLVDDKVDMFNISCGNHEDPAMFCRTHPNSFFPRGVNVYLAAEIKKHVKKPVACVGSLNDPAHIEQIIASGQADMVEIGRALVADPFLPKKALEGHADDINPCLRCYECFGATGQLEMIKCTVNPTQGQQLQLSEIKPAAQKKKVLIAGGGPAGMQAAITAAQRGHDVTLAEKAGRLGGNLHPAGAAFFKEDIRKLCVVMEKRVHAANVKVLLNTEVTPEFVKDFAPDALIVAIGSDVLVPPIPGIRGENVITAIDAELNPDKLGKRVAIMGGGLVGAEAACAFAHEGHEVTIIEMKPDVAMEVNSFYRGGLMPHVHESATLLLKTKVKQITDKGVLVENDEKGEFLVEADTVVNALGLRAPFARADALMDAADEAYVIGDCQKISMIYKAINEGHWTALQL